MELHVLGVIFIVFLVSLCSLLFISKLPRGKTFDEVLAEKRQLSEKIYGLTGSKKKPKKIIKKTKEKSKIYNKDNNKESELESPVDSDAPSESNKSIDINNSPIHITDKGHVEFTEEEILTESNLNSNKRSLSGTRKKKEPRKNSLKTPGSGILINKTEPVLIKDENSVAIVNHFEEIHPKDDVEILRSQNMYKLENGFDNNENVHSVKHDNKVQKESKKNKHLKKQVIMNNLVKIISVENAVPTKEIKLDDALIVKNKDLIKPKDNAVNTLPAKDKSNKKHKNELALIQKLFDDREDISVNFLILLLSKADFTRSEIQILIDYLLNKQSDTITVNHSEWSEGKSDVVQKLKKQLSEKEKALEDEQLALIRLQDRLKEIRVEINSERAQFNMNIKQNQEELQAKVKEIQNLSTDLKFLNEKYILEKQTYSVQIQQLQNQIMQDKKTNTQEHLQQIQNLTENNNQLQNEIHSNNIIINEMKEQFQKFAADKHQFGEETIKKMAEYEKQLSEYEIIGEQRLYMEQELNSSRKRMQEMVSRDKDITEQNKRLSLELTRRQEEYEKLYSLQQYDLEKYKSQLNEQNKTSHMDDQNKVEIRNLQNALDSSRTELNLSRAEISDYRAKFDEILIQNKDMQNQISSYNNKSLENSKQIKDLNVIITNYKSSEMENLSKLAEFEKQMQFLICRDNELKAQIEEQKTKNNDLRTKNWKLIEALKLAEQNKVVGSVVNTDLDEVIRSKVLHDEQSKLRSTIENILTDMPKGPLKFVEWTEHLLCYLKQLTSSNSNSINNDNKQNGGSDVEKLLLKNAQLQKTVEEYKTIIAETEKILNDLEAKGKEQESYWRNVVHTKDEELKLLKSNLEQVNY